MGDTRYSYYDSYLVRLERRYSEKLVYHIMKYYTNIDKKLYFTNENCDN